MAGDITRQAVIAAWLCIPIAPAAADTVTLRYGQIPSTVRSVSAVYLSIAQQKGFFAREEVKLDLIPIAGGTDKMIAALDQSTVDVTQTATPYLTRAVLSGSDAVAIAGETANPVYRDAVVRFVRALAVAFRFIRDPANREEVATAIVKLTGSPDQIARQTLALYFEPERGVLPKQAEIDLNGLTQVIAFMGEGGAIKPPLPHPNGSWICSICVPPASSDPRSLIFFDALDIHHPTPSRRITLDVVLHLLRRGSHRYVADAGKLFANFRELQDLPDLMIEPLDDRARDTRRRCKAEPRHDLETRQRLADGRDVGLQHKALA